MELLILDELQIRALYCHNSKLYDSLLNWLPAFLPPCTKGRWAERQVWFK